MIACPSAAQWQLVLTREDLTDEELALTHHAEACLSCRRLLDTLTRPDGVDLARQLQGQRNQATPSPAFAHTRLRPQQKTGDTSATGGGAPLSEPPQVQGYEILAELGRGGMGVVYRARHLELDRIVALKMLHAGSDADRETLARFRDEAKVIARLQHPGIVQIHEIGTLEGKPYLALEYVPGPSLDRLLQGTPQPPRAAAELLLSLAQALHAAHLQGILHRDLKPANVLLTRKSEIRNSASETNLKSKEEKIETAAPVISDFGFGSFGVVSDGEFRISDFLPKVTDFGLAKTLDEDSGRTAAGMIVGTPSYMAPEQTTGDTALGPAADVHALGAILYEMLTGRPPFKGVTAIDTIHLVRTEEPVPPRRLQPRTPRDLETLCLKCLHKDPAKRYATAQQLAADVQRYLEGRPIQARPVGRLERGWRWCRRNPAVAGLAGGLAAVILAALVGMTTLYWEADAQRQRAESEARDARTFAHEADRQRADALEYFEVARGAIETFHTRVMTDERLTENNFRPLRTALLEATIRFHEALIRRRTDDPRLQAAQGRAWRQLGDLRQELGQHDAALRAYGQAIALFTPLSAHPAMHTAALQELAGSHHNRALLLGKLRRMEEAFADYRSSLALHEQGARENPHNRTALFNWLGCRANYARTLAEAGQPAAAIDLLRANVEPFEQLAAADPTREHRAGLAVLHHNLGIFLMPSRQGEDWLRHLRRSRAVFTTLLQDFPQDPGLRYGLAQCCGNLGAGLHGLHRDDEEQAALVQGQSLCEELVRDHPNVPEYRLTLGGFYCNLGISARTRDMPAVALSWQASAIRVLRGVLDSEPRSTHAREFLRNSYQERALALEQLRRCCAAWRDSRRAADLRVGLPTRSIQELAARTLPRARAEIAWLTAFAGGVATRGGVPGFVLGEVVPWLLWVQPHSER